MPRTKADHKGTVRGVGSLIWTDPLYANTELPAPKFPGHLRTVPAIDCTGPDGRRWLVTFESEFAAPFDGTSREQYISRMRHLAVTLQMEADRMEADPNR